MSVNINSLIIPQDDLTYILQQTENEVSTMVAGMLSLINTNETLNEGLQNQPWCKRMFNTIIGKNKATVMEIRQNHDKLNTYVVQAVGELYNRNKINSQIMVSLSLQITQLYNSHLELKGILHSLVSRLNEKIESIDNYHTLLQEIDEGVYGNKPNITGLLSVISQIDRRMIADSKKMRLLELKLSSKNILNTDIVISVKDFLLEITNLDEESLGVVYADLQLYQDDYIIVALAFNTIERWNLLPVSNRKLLKKQTIIDKIISEFDVDESVEISFYEFYDEVITLRQNLLYSMNTLPAKNETGSDSVDYDENEEGEDSENTSVSANVPITDDTPTTLASPIIEPEEKEELFIREKITLESDDTKEFINKIIHFYAPIHAPSSGNAIIKFKNCTIYFGDVPATEESIDWVQCNEIHMADCRIEGISYTKDNYFIYASNIKLTDCKLINCANFIRTNDPYPNNAKVQLSNCFIINPGQHFLYGYDTDNLMDNCLVTYKNIPAFIDTKEQCMFCDNLRLDHCTMSGRPQPDDSVHSNYHFAKTNSFIMKNCSFIHFESIIDMGYKGNSSHMEWCIFNKCSQILSTGRNHKTTINNCQFNQCYKNVLYFEDGRSVISECEFNDWHGTERSNVDKLSEELLGIDPLSLLKYRKYDTADHLVSKCVFNNANAFYNFLISASIIKYTNTFVANVRDCSFNNCTTKRSSGKRIKHYGTYFNVFKQQKHVQVINSDNGKYTSEKVSYTVLATNSSGDKIGSSLTYDPVEEETFPAVENTITEYVTKVTNSDENIIQNNDAILSELEKKNLAYGALYYYLTENYNAMISLPIYSSISISEQLKKELEKFKLFSPMLFSDLEAYLHDVSKVCALSLLKQVVSLLESRSAVTESMKSKIKRIEQYTSS